MKKIRALIVDDEPIARRGIRQHLRNETDVEIVGECRNGREAVAAIQRDSPDLVFLDVQMPLLDGFGVLHEIGSAHAPAIVFITAYDQHAIRAFDVNALDYLLKPIDGDRFQTALTRVRRQLQNSNAEDLKQKLVTLLEHLGKSQTDAKQKYLDRVVIKESGRVFFLRTNEIDWLNAQGNYVLLHTKNSTHLLRETINGMESKLDPEKFLRIRRSTMVRIERIKELQPLFNGEYAVILKDGTQLTSSRRYRPNVDAFLKG